MLSRRESDHWRGLGPSWPAGDGLDQRRSAGLDQLAVAAGETEGPVEGDEEGVTTVGQGEGLAISMLIVTAVVSVEGKHRVR